MLVSSIARFNSARAMNDSVFGIMQTTSGMINAAGSMNAFGGENDLALINQIDQKLTIGMLKNSLKYKLAYLQLKTAEKCGDENKKSGFSAIA